ncbi:MAG TPA: GyrI-like domain-containing protein [Anaerolineaceae bacterium]
MEYVCELKDRPETPTICIRTRTGVENLANVVGPAFGALGGYLAQSGAQPVGAPYIAYFNMDMQDLELEIGFPLAAPVAGQGVFEPGRLPAGQYAVTLHRGPYTNLGDAYEALNGFLGALERQPTGVVYEVYHNAPDEVAPEELLTEIQFPLAPET